MNEEVVGYQGRELTYHINSRRSVFDILLCQWVRDKKRSRLFVPTFNHVWKNIFKNTRTMVAIAILTCLCICLFTPLNQLFDRVYLTQTRHNLGNWAECLFVYL